MSSHPVRQKKNGDLGTARVRDSHCQPAHLEDARNSRLISWFERWRMPMRRWLASHSSVPAADLDDLAQEAFLRLLRYSDDVLVEHPQTYLFRIAANVANEWRERARNSRPHDDVWLENLQIETGEEPENAIGRTLVHEHVRAAVQQLPQRQREVLLLHVAEDLTYVQIAERLGLTRRMVKRDLALAYSRLRWELDAVHLKE
jgi:RNA polymerase sigma-70 factor (ECF subfamily)